MRHNLKIDRKWLLSVRAREKKAEIRRADRDFCIDDELLLYTVDRREAELVRVTHMLPLGEVPGLERCADYVSLSVEWISSYSGDAVECELAQGDFGGPAS